MLEEFFVLLEIFQLHQYLKATRINIRDQIANICWIIKKGREFQKNIYFCFIDYAKAFDCVDHKNCGKFFKRWEYQTTSPASWEICIQVKNQQLEYDIHNSIDFLES